MMRTKKTGGYERCRSFASVAADPVEEDGQGGIFLEPMPRLAVFGVEIIDDTLVGDSGNFLYIGNRAGNVRF